MFRCGLDLFHMGECGFPAIFHTTIPLRQVPSLLEARGMAFQAAYVGIAGRPGARMGEARAAQFAGVFRTFRGAAGRRKRVPMEPARPALPFSLRFIGRKTEGATS
jgi:hypothetical protein